MIKKILGAFIVMAFILVVDAVNRASSNPQLLKYQIGPFEYLRLSPNDHTFSYENTFLLSFRKTYLEYTKRPWTGYTCYRRQCKKEWARSITHAEMLEMLQYLSTYIEEHNIQKVHDTFPGCIYVAYVIRDVGNAIPLRTQSCDVRKIVAGFWVYVPDYKPEIYVTLPKVSPVEAEVLRAKVLDVIVSLVDLRILADLPESISKIEISIEKESQQGNFHLGKSLRQSVGSEEVRIRIGEQNLAEELYLAMFSLIESES